MYLRVSYIRVGCDRDKISKITLQGSLNSPFWANFRNSHFGLCPSVGFLSNYN